TAMPITVSLSAPSGKVITADFSTQDDVAKSPNDYQAVTNFHFTFQEEVTTQTTNVTVNVDITNEADDRVFLNISHIVTAAPGDVTSNGVILNDDPEPTLSISDVTQKEGTGGITAFSFLVTLSAVSGQEVSATYTTMDDTAVAGKDYIATTGKVVFP